MAAAALNAFLVLWALAVLFLLGKIASHILALHADIVKMHKGGWVNHPGPGKIVPQKDYKDQPH